MDVKQEILDPNIKIIKLETVLFSDQMDGHELFSTKDETFKNDQDYVLSDTDNICEYQTTREFVNFEEIKQECKLPKIEFLENTEYKSVPDNVNNVPNTVKKELESANEIKAADFGDVKPVISEYIQFKDESELLTSHCDLSTLKSEPIDYPDYLEQPCSSKQTIINSKSSKHSERNVSKQKKSALRSVLQKIFRSSKKNLFNAQFGRCYETCCYCGQFFFTKSQFLYHFIVVHYAKKVTKVCKQKFGQHKDCRCNNCLHTIFRHPSTSNNIFHSNENSFRCEICSKQFTRNASLLQHLKFHTREKKRCEICSKQFIRKNDLKRHLQIHTGEKPFNCECSTRFSRKGGLKKHIKIHTGEKPLKCEICSKQFELKCSLKTHLKIHAGAKLFKCEKCSKQFTRKTNLNGHLKIHTEGKQFKCEICSKQFIQKGDLKKHLKIHTGEKPFICEICSKSFSRNGHLKAHLLTHSEEKPFKCEICSKPFTRKDKLEKHLQAHTEGKPFQCEICSKRFVQKSNLNVHLKIHTGEKPFECEICSKRFLEKNNLKKHLRTHIRKKLKPI